MIIHLADGKCYVSLCVYLLTVAVRYSFEPHQDHLGFKLESSVSVQVGQC
jgi:hypothetical protein